MGEDIGVTTAIFILPFRGPAIVILHRMMHRLYIYNVGNFHSIQSDDQNIYFSLHPDEFKCMFPPKR